MLMRKYHEQKPISSKFYFVFGGLHNYFFYGIVDIVMLIEIDESY
jgi:hypothetical protein